MAGGVGGGVGGSGCGGVAFFEAGYRSECFLQPGALARLQLRDGRVELVRHVLNTTKKTISDATVLK